MKEYIIKNGKQLRLGYTTGTCAAAAAKAATWMLLTGRRRERIGIHTPMGMDLELEVHDIRMSGQQVSCAIEKDGGDDPDITCGAYIYATVSILNENKSKSLPDNVGRPGGRTESQNDPESSLDNDIRPGKKPEVGTDPNNGTENRGKSISPSHELCRVLIDGGEGVGRVTKRGLDQPVGAAAINSIPRQMIRENVEEVCRLMEYDGDLSVVISVPGGEELARKTFNPRLGITGGISILGTTGIVEPMSEQALVDTIRVELNQHRAEGMEYVLLTPGNYGADYIRKGIGMDPSGAVLVSNFIGDALDLCKELGFKGALLVGHIGKLVKISGGMMNTHSRYGDCRMEIMASYAAACGLSQEAVEEMLSCATCDDALRILYEADAQREDILTSSDAAQNGTTTGITTENNTGGNKTLAAAVLDRLQKKIAFILDNRVFGEMQTGAVLFSKEYGFLCETESAGELLEKIRNSEYSRRAHES